MKNWDVIIIGAGIIGLSLAISLRKQGLRVLVVERGEPGREASYAAAGMLVPSGAEIPPALSNLAETSAAAYPEFVHELEDESGIKTDFREQGTIVFSSTSDFPSCAKALSPTELSSLEPDLRFSDRALRGELKAAFMQERSVDPRSLVSAATKAARHRGIDISSGSEVKSVLISEGHAAGVQTDRTSYSAPMVVNCAGAWAAKFSPTLPVHPVKGQMLAVVQGPMLRHVVRSEKVYIVPRSDGRLVIGSTLENAGYDKHVDVNTISALFHAAVELVPGLQSAREHECWAGLRPGTADRMPILGETSTRGFFAATGHYRDGILLAPITAKVLTNVMLGRVPSCDIAACSPSRFT